MLLAAKVTTDGFRGRFYNGIVIVNPSRNCSHIQCRLLQHLLLIDSRRNGIAAIRRMGGLVRCWATVGAAFRAWFEAHFLCVRWLGYRSGKVWRLLRLKRWRLFDVCLIG